MSVVLWATLVLSQGPDTGALAARVKQLTDSYLAAYFERHPDEATLDGVAGVRHDGLPDNSVAALARWQRREGDWLAELRHIDPDALVDRPEWIAYGIVREYLEGAVATRVCHRELWNVSHVNDGWLPMITSLAALQPVGTMESRGQTLTRWQALPAYIATETENQRAGAHEGFTAPRGNVQVLLAQLDAVLGTPLDQSPLLDPARRDSSPSFARHSLGSSGTVSCRRSDGTGTS